jgi:hypothetical protein
MEVKVRKKISAHGINVKSIITINIMGKTSAQAIDKSEAMTWPKHSLDLLALAPIVDWLSHRRWRLQLAAVIKQFRHQQVSHLHA